MISHLLKTDWQALRKPIVAVWIIQFLAALPWLLHDPGGFDVPMSNASSSSGSLIELGFSIRTPLNEGIIRLISVGAALLLSTSIGMHDQRWQAASPIRPWMRLAAKTFAVLLFVIAPQLLLGAGVMLRHGFELPSILAAGFTSLLTLALLHASACVFGRCCASFWPWSAAVVCLTAIALAIPFGIILPVFWMDHPGPRVWILGGVSLIGLSLVSRCFRSGNLSSVIGASAAIVLAGVASSRVPFTLWIPEKSVDSSGITVALDPAGLRTETIRSSTNGRESVLHRHTGQLLSTGLPPQSFVVWHEGDRTYDSAVLLSRVTHGGTRKESLEVLLPEPLVTYDVHNQPDITLSSGQMENPAHLTGLVFRYETLIDMPLDSESIGRTKAGAAFNARLHPTEKLGPLVEVAFGGILAGIGHRGDETTPANTYYRHSSLTYVLHLPAENRCIELTPDLRQTGHLPGGGSWSRLVLGTGLGGHAGAWSLSGARLIVLRPLLLDVIERELAIPSNVPTSPEDTTDWMLSYRYGLEDAAYFRDYLPNRPDPATCDAAQFARYLRAVSSVSRSTTVEQDLAEYAPRFPELLALHSRRQAAADAVASGVPEPEKEALLALLDDPRRAFDLADVIDSRGWGSEARDALLACLDPPFMARNGGSIHQVVAALAELEDPETYPALLNAFRQTRRFQIYNIIRELPGIGPGLDEVIAGISASLPESPGILEIGTNARMDALGVFSAPVAHGDRAAFTKFLSYFRASTVDPAYYVPVESIDLIVGDTVARKDVHGFLAGKTVDDFRYDPLARRWRPASPNP